MSGWISNLSNDADHDIMAKVCVECPWNRERNSRSAFPAHREGIFNKVANGQEMACHMSLGNHKYANTAEDTSKFHRCRGIEHFRANIGVDSDVEPSTQVFESKEEALKVWPKHSQDWEALRRDFFREFPYGEWEDELGRTWLAGVLQETQNEASR